MKLYGYSPDGVDKSIQAAVSNVRIIATGNQDYFVNAGFPGDINADGHVGLVEALNALQHVVEMRTP